MAIDDEPRDQALISTGLNDRNLDDFLSVIESRVDDLIQVIIR
jgi:hypothetical protein